MTANVVVAAGRHAVTRFLVRSRPGAPADAQEVAFWEAGADEASLEKALRRGLAGPGVGFRYCGLTLAGTQRCVTRRGIGCRKVALLFRSLPNTICDHGSVVIDGKRDGALEAVGSRNE